MITDLIHRLNANFPISFTGPLTFSIPYEVAQLPAVKCAITDDVGDIPPVTLHPEHPVFAIDPLQRLSVMMAVIISADLQGQLPKPEGFAHNGFEGATEQGGFRYE